MEFERLLSPSGPCMGHMERPSDKKEPGKIAWLQCVGSRDMNRACHGYCSSVCCMYAIKQAVIAREHSHSGELDASIFFMDMRTHGKEFEEYYNRAAGEGVAFHRARVHSVLPSGENDNLRIRFADEHGNIQYEDFDLVVLSVGLEMPEQAIELAEKAGITLDADKFIITDPFKPVSTTREGVFVCGAAAEPKDIPQSVMEASAAALEAGRILAPARWTDTSRKQYPPEKNVYAEPPRVGVFVCSCGINIASVVDVESVTEYAKTLPGVVFAQNNLFTCSQDTIGQMEETIRREGLNRVVVASCTPRTHEPLFQETLRNAGINKYLFEMANIRDQDSWVHQKEPEAATQKAKDLVRVAVSKVRGDAPLPYNSVKVTKAALVVGGGVAGMTAAVSLADQGFPVTLVERKDDIGGHARKFFRTWQGNPVQEYLGTLKDTVRNHRNIDLKCGVSVDSVSGSVGSFTTHLTDGTEINHGVAIISIGAGSFKPDPDSRWNYLWGKNPNVYNLLQLDQRFIAGDSEIPKINQTVFIHCVGSRVPERPYCSRVCCTHAIDQALHLRELNPDMDIFMLYRDIRTYGQRERLYREAREKGIVFIRYDLENLPVVTETKGKIQVKVTDPLIDTEITLHPDMLVLATAVRPKVDVHDLAKFFKCSIRADGYLMEAHMKLRPVDFATDGIFLAGLCHYPKPMDETIAQAQAAAARASIVLSQDEIPAESITAVVNPQKCTGCAVCTEVCAYNAVTVDPDTEKAVVNEAMCKGCGACVAGCRSDAITLKNMGNEQIMAELETIMDNW